MSTSIDSRVVQMTFDNQQFEQNAQTSLSTLDRLTKALKFDKATDGLASISNSVKGFSLNGMEESVLRVQNKFSALQAVAFTCLQNITNTALQAGKMIVNALAIDPITTGFQEYETQINAVQTILSNTRSKGTTIDDVNRALDELNTYADKTIYNFTEMTRNIGTFTAAGVELQTATKSIQGIANLAAVSGSTSQQASTAMYQLSQALAAGTVKLQDWNSVVNAGMGGEVFQNALKRTASAMGTDVDAMIEKYGSFRESLTQGEWLTTEVLTETLNQFANVYSKKELIQKGYTDAQANEILALGRDAEDAATKVKTVTQLWDTLKEAAQSGWTQSWEILVGDFYQARTLLTEISDHIGAIINAQSEARNTLLRQAFGKQTIDEEWYNFIKDNANLESERAVKGFKIVAKEYGINLDKMIEDTGSFEKSLKNGWLDRQAYGALLKYTNGMTKTVKSTKEAEAEHSKLTRTMHNLLHGEYKDSSEIMGELNKKGVAASAAYASLSARLDKNHMALTRLDDEALKKAGYDKNQIKNLHLLNEGFKDLDDTQISIMKKLEQETGRDMAIEGIKNILSLLAKYMTSIGKAYREVFGYLDGFGVYNAIKKFRDWTRSLVLTDKAAKNVTKSFIPLFVALKGGLTVGTQFVKMGGKILGLFLKLAGASLRLAVDVGNFVKEIISAVAGSEEWTKFVDAAAKKITEFKTAISNSLLSFNRFTSSLNQLDGIKNLTAFFKELGVSIKEFASSNIKAAFEVITNFINSFHIRAVNFDGFSESVSKLANDIADFFKKTRNAKENSEGDAIDVLSKFSDKAKMVGEKLQGAAAVIGSARDAMFDALDGFREKIGKVFANFDLNRTLDILKSGAFLAIVVRIAQFINSLKNLSDRGNGIGRKFENILSNISRTLEAYQVSIHADTMLKIAEAIGILAASIFVLSFIPSDKLADVTVDMGILLLLMALIVKLGVGLKEEAIDLQEGAAGVVGAINNFVSGIKNAITKSAKMIGFSVFLVALATSVAMLAVTLITLADLPVAEAIGPVFLLGTLMVLLLKFAEQMSVFSDTFTLSTAATIYAIGAAIEKLTVPLLLFSKMPFGELLQGGGAVVALLAGIALVAAASSKSRMVGLGVGLMILAGALILLLPSIIAFSNVPWDVFGKGAAMIGILAVGLGLISTLAAGSMAGAAAIFVMAAALTVLSVPLLALGILIGPAVLGLAALGAAILILSAGALIATALAAGFAVLQATLATLATSIVIAGAGFFLMGAGLLAASIGALTMGKALPVLAHGIVDAFTIIGDAAGKIAITVGNVVAAVAEGIIMAAPKVAVAVVTLLGTILNTILDYGPTFLEGLSGFIDTTITALAEDLETKFPILLKSIGSALIKILLSISKLKDAIIRIFFDIEKSLVNMMIEAVAQILDAFGPMGEKMGDFLRDHKFKVSEVFDKDEAKKAADETAAATSESFAQIDLSAETTKGNIEEALGGIKLDTSGFDKYKDDAIGKLDDLIGQADGKSQQLNEILSNAGSGVQMDTSGAESTVKQLTKSLGGASKSSGKEAEKTGKVFINTLVKTLGSGGSKVESKGKELGRKGAKGAHDQRDKFRAAGVHTMSGLISGLNSKINECYQKGAAAGRAFTRGYEANKKISSPSKEMAQEGKWTMQGLLNGITRMIPFVYKAGSSVGSEFTKSISNLSGRVQSLLEDGVDLRPTITPVLNTDNVDKGLARINGSFGNRTLTLSANTLDGVASMRKGSQNRSNMDVISAINRLGKNIKEMPRNSYSINGITYDDGSNITGAIDTLVRAVLVEGRA